MRSVVFLACPVAPEVARACFARVRVIDTAIAESRHTRKALG